MINARDISVSYGRKQIIKRLSLEINEGGITCLIGPNGSGKSTLLRALSGAIKPVAGEVWLEGLALRHWKARQLARKLAMLPQHPEAPEGLLVRQLVKFGRFPHQGPFGGSTGEDERVVNWAIEMTGLSALSDRPLSALSGGERQRAWIAMTIAQQSPILFLDEPTTFLDIGHQLEVLELLQRLNQTQGMTVVMSLHDLNQAARYGHHLIVMQQGHLIAKGSPESVMTHRMLAEVFRINARVEKDPESGAPMCWPLQALPTF